MIDKFSTVYAGHVDLGDMGQQATPANARRYSNDHLASVFAKTEAIARRMDEHGYLSNSMGTPQNVMLEQLAWLGKEVMPSFVAR